MLLEILKNPLRVSSQGKVWLRHTSAKVKLSPLSPSELLLQVFHLTFPFQTLLPFYLTDHQHFWFWHSQMIWSFNLLKGLQQAVFHINHTELLLHQDFSRLKNRTTLPTTKDILYGTDVANCLTVVAAPWAFLNPCVFSLTWYYLIILSKLHTTKYNVSPENVRSQAS